MARIRNAKGRRANQSPSGYTRLFGHSELGNLLSRVQGTVISAGTELERLLLQKSQPIEHFDQFIRSLDDHREGVFVASKKQVKESEVIQSVAEPDLLAFNLRERICHVIEVKDGDTFDTKKVAGERANLQQFINDAARHMPFAFMLHVCGFNVRTREELYEGLKRRFPVEELLTGAELCALLQIDYDEIIAIRTADYEDNLQYFIEQLVAIPEIANAVQNERG